MNITLAKYNEIIEKLTDCVTQYEKMNYWYNTHTMYLASGDTLNIKFLKNGIAHLLGVNIEYLKMANKFRPDMNTYECLKYFLDNSYSFSKIVIDDKQMTFDNMFSPYIDNKLDCFIKNIKIRTDDIYFMVKYDREKTYQLTQNADVCDYYIIRKIYNDYYVLGLKKNDNDYYLPVTSRKYTDYIEFDKFAERISKKQEITYPYLMTIKNPHQDFDSKYTSKIDEKKILLDKTIRFASRYDAVPSVARDFSYMISNSINARIKRNEEISILNLLTDSIKSKSILDYDTITSICEVNDLSDGIQSLINACNDVMCSGIEFDNKDSYSQISSERDKYKEELEQLKQQLLESNNANEQLKQQNELLINENNQYQEQFDIIANAVQKIKK